jgi:hypothetical protein
VDKKEIDAFINDCNDVAERIKFIDRLITKVEREELKNEYRNQMLVLIDDYGLMCKLLTSAIKKYNKEHNDNIEYFAYHKILRGMKN